MCLNSRSMLEVIITNYKPITKILLIFVIFVSIHVIIFFDNIKNHVLDNWPEYRNKPWMLPISGFIKPIEGKTSLESTVINFRKVISKMISSILSILMKPIYSIMDVFLKIFSSFGTVLQGIRKQINVMRNFLFKLFENMYIRIQTGLAAITYFFLKLRESLKKSYGLFNLVLQSVEHSAIFFETLVKGPVGQFGKLVDQIGWSSAVFTLGPFGQKSWDNALCFSPNTPVLMNSGFMRVMNDINVGDVLYKNNTVLAKIDVTYNLKHIYSLYGVEVTGSHLVYFNYKWIRVHEHPDAKTIHYNLDKVVCLVTKKGTISINNIEFKDYLETKNITITRDTDKIIEDYLNKTTMSEYTRSADLLVGIPQTSKIYNMDVIGTVYIDSDMLIMYIIDGQLISSNALVLEKGIWVRTYNHSRATLVGRVKCTCVNYVTGSEKILLDNGLIIRDFTETRDVDINNKIDKYVESCL
jgi:hypothetical protein